MLELLAAGLSFASLNGKSGQVIRVPTDSSARYELVSLDRNERGLVEIVTRRQGRSGVSYSRREINCQSRTFRYLGDGDTIEAMNRSRPSPSMSSLVSGSISDYVVRYACENIDR